MNASAPSLKAMAPTKSLKAPYWSAWLGWSLPLQTKSFRVTPLCTTGSIHMHLTGVCRGRTSPPPLFRSQAGYVECRW